MTPHLRMEHSSGRDCQALKQQNPASKKSSGNRFEVLDIETRRRNKRKDPWMENQEADPRLMLPSG